MAVLPSPLRHPEAWKFFGILETPLNVRWHGIATLASARKIAEKPIPRGALNYRAFARALNSAASEKPKLAEFPRIPLASDARRRNISERSTLGANHSFKSDVINEWGRSGIAPWAT